jgi:D-xylose transport system substrate-binding protein
MHRITIRPAALAATLALALGTTACGNDDGGGASAGAKGGAKIALLLPENKTTRYEAHDRPGFQRELAKACPDCELLYFNAGQDAARQQQQVEAAITEGAKVLVISAVDVQSAPAYVQRAKQAGVRVIAYERMIPADVDYYLSYDNCRVGELQAQALVKRLEADGNRAGPIVKINGSPTDSNALEFKRCSTKVFDAAGVKVAREYDTPDWSPDKAQQEMEQAIAALGRDGFKGVYAANDGTAGGAIAAMAAAGVDSSEIPVTGQDAELAAVQRVLAGEQFMTIYKAIAPESAISAKVAAALARGDEPPAETVNRQVDNGKAKVPSMVFDPIVVTRDNVQQTVVKDGFWPVSDLCAGKLAASCRDAGVEPAGR